MDESVRILQLIESLSVPVDTSAVQRAAMEAILAAVDRNAAILTTQEVERIRKEKAGLSPDGEEDGKSVRSAEKWTETLCYLQLAGVYPGAGRQVADALQGMASGRTARVVLDLRGARGEDLKSVDEICGLVLEAGTALFSVVDGKGNAAEKHAAANMDGRLTMPAILVVDEETSCAAELLVGVLKGAPGIVVVGRNTKGDARLREPFALGDGRFLYIGARRLVPATGRSYDPEGVAPDVRVLPREERRRAIAARRQETAGRPLSEDEQRRIEVRKKARGDVALEKAMDVLVGLDVLCSDAGRSTRF